MTISVVDGSVTMSNSNTYQANLPMAVGGLMSFKCSSLDVYGKCAITGEKDDKPAGWTLGIIQLQWIETNWGWYRGQSEKDGSSFVQRGRPPARPRQSCRDNGDFGRIFYDSFPPGTAVATAGQVFPIEMKVNCSDSPSEEYALARINSKTRKANFLYKVQLEFHFCTVLSLCSPNGFDYKHLAHLLWNVHWEDEFQPANFANPTAAPWTIKPTAGGNTFNVSRIFDGGPTDPKFTSIITSPSALRCNAVADSARTNAIPRESSGWELFSVTQ